MIQIDREITQDYERASGLEWLETNGLGGWAGTTVAGAHSRRYHGLLVAATEPPSERTVLLSRLDETLHLEGETYELSCNQFPGAVVPRGFEHLTSFHKDLFPVFEYEAGGVRLRKTVAAVDGENTTLVLYEVLEAPGSFILSLRPFLAARDQHTLSSANPRISQETPFEGGVLRLRPYPDVPEVFLQVPGADFRSNPQWWYRFEYEKDRRRGFEFQEDLWTPGLFGLELAPGDRLGIVISTRNPEGRDAFALFEKERKRREKIVKALPVQDDFARFLALAADSFVVRRGPNQRAVVAGYPFGERSRDTMIALPGLCLVTGRHEDAKKILRAFAKSPGDQTPVDAPLWMFVASWKYLQATGDEAFVRETLLPALRKVIHRYDKERLQELKTAEANALWYNALAILAEIEARVGDPEEAKRLDQRAKRVHKGFQETSWNEEAGEQVHVLSLPFSPLPKPKAAKLLAAIEEKAAPGTTWSPLLGPYLTALVRIHGAVGRKKALAIVEQLKPRLIEAGVGSLSEESEAWTVAEVLRAYVEDLQGGAKETPKKPVRAARKEDGPAPKAPARRKR
ncbi:MAG TPA: glycogen debranching enzyme N-terminal domain-containing protein [Thermoanaerobaculia bacterium]|nr:glycogen debranching enzyme N-terminal domain-containing protein [Thermoanaerobaculia bacterium]